MSKPVKRLKYSPPGGDETRPVSPTVEVSQVSFSSTSTTSSATATEATVKTAALSATSLTSKKPCTEWEKSIDDAFYFGKLCWDEKDDTSIRKLPTSWLRRCVQIAMSKNPIVFEDADKNKMRSECTQMMKSIYNKSKEKMNHEYGSGGQSSSFIDRLPSSVASNCMTWISPIDKHSIYRTSRSLRKLMELPSSWSSVYLYVSEVCLRSFARVFPEVLRKCAKLELVGSWRYKSSSKTDKLNLALLMDALLLASQDLHRTSSSFPVSVRCVADAVQDCSSSSSSSFSCSSDVLRKYLSLTSLEVAANRFYTYCDRLSCLHSVHLTEITFISSYGRSIIDVMRKILQLPEIVELTMRECRENDNPSAVIDNIIIGIPTQLRVLVLKDCMSLTSKQVMLASKSWDHANTTHLPSWESFFLSTSSSSSSSSSSSLSSSSSHFSSLSSSSLSSSSSSSISSLVKLEQCYMGSNFNCVPHLHPSCLGGNLRELSISMKAISNNIREFSRIVGRTMPLLTYLCLSDEALPSSELFAWNELSNLENLQELIVFNCVVSHFFFFVCLFVCFVFLLSFF